MYYSYELDLNGVKYECITPKKPEKNRVFAVTMDNDVPLMVDLKYDNHIYFDESPTMGKIDFKRVGVLKLIDPKDYTSEILQLQKKYKTKRLFFTSKLN